MIDFNSVPYTQFTITLQSRGSVFQWRGSDGTEHSPVFDSQQAALDHMSAKYPGHSLAITPPAHPLNQ